MKKAQGVSDKKPFQFDLFYMCMIVFVDSLKIISFGDKIIVVYFTNLTNYYYAGKYEEAEVL